MKLKNKIKEFAQSKVPHESCGLILFEGDNIEFIECENLSTDKRNKFSIDPVVSLQAMNRGKIICFHSHVDDFPKAENLEFSKEDRIVSDECLVPMLLYAYPNDQFAYYCPEDSKDERLKFLEDFCNG